MKLIRLAWGITVLVSLLTVSQAVAAQTKSSSARISASKAGQSSSGPSEGIKVHGHWMIVIRNRDGSVASRREFENELYKPSGNAFLVALLAGQAGQFGWRVMVGSGSPGLNFCGTSTVKVDCVLAESSDTSTFPGYTKSLTVTVPDSGTNTGQLVLSGSATADFDGQIKDVSTVINSSTQGAQPFTGTIISPAIAVKGGQTMNVTVVISFS